MSYAQSCLEYSIWATTGTISDKKFFKGQYNVRKNVKKDIGEIVYCPRCHKRFTKTHKLQYACSDKCEEKLAIYANSQLEFFEKYKSK